eukprot:COSAG04_NODE_578_length_12431_cov_22.470808_3_plen_353_part_00
MKYKQPGKHGQAQPPTPRPLWGGGQGGGISSGRTVVVDELDRDHVYQVPERQTFLGAAPLLVVVDDLDAGRRAPQEDLLDAVRVFAARARAVEQLAAAPDGLLPRIAGQTAKPFAHQRDAVIAVRVDLAQRPRHAPLDGDHRLGQQVVARAAPPVQPFRRQPSHKMISGMYLLYLNEPRLVQLPLLGNNRGDVALQFGGGGDLDGANMLGGRGPAPLDVRHAPWGYRRARFRRCRKLFGAERRGVVRDLGAPLEHGGLRARRGRVSCKAPPPPPPPRPLPRGQRPGRRSAVAAASRPSPYQIRPGPTGMPAFCQVLVGRADIVYIETVQKYNTRTGNSGNSAARYNQFIRRN